MQLDDPLWPSLREAARRFLREDSCKLIVDEKYHKNALHLVQNVADYVPSKIHLPTVETGRFSIENQAFFGTDEPSLDVVWVPNCTWKDFEEQVLDLLKAGYPGCVGCGGPGSEGPWDEASRRSEFSG